MNRASMEAWVLTNPAVGHWALTPPVITKGKNYYVRAKCSCGFTADVSFYSLIGGRTRSCTACFNVLRKTKYKSAEAKRISIVLKTARDRCVNANSRQYADYGARGICFCFSSVEEGVKYVLENLGPRLSEKHSLDRKNNDGNYEAGNLRWATRSEQNTNQRKPSKRKN